jgi:tetratricopeptide (TPR) repeat protein
MDEKSPVKKALALEPADAPTRSGDGALSDAEAKRDLHITTADEFLAKAAKEYQTGNIDQALWRRAMEQGGNDESLVIAAYLRTRATALQLQQKKEERSEIQARGAGRSRSSERKAASEGDVEQASTKFVGVRPRSSKPRPWQIGAGVAGLITIVILVYLMVSPPRESEPVRTPVVAAASRAPGPSVQASPSKNEPPVSKNAGSNAEPALAVTVQQLKSVGKWNVLVLNANEWTRQEPGNATAWMELSFGYAKLQQYNDALDAATKAVQLAPADPVIWRNLGQINLVVDRLPEAAYAFGKALELRPDDADAQCGATVVAQKLARSKDTEATIRRVKPVDGSCPGLLAAEPAVVAPPSPPAGKLGAPLGR